MKLIKAVASVVLAVVLLAALGAFAARFHDGPLAILPGGPLVSGPWVDAGRVDWSFADDFGEVEFESHGRSRTTGIVVHEGEAYIPCSLGFPPGKRWHQEILERPEGVLRIDGKRYKRRFVRVEDEALHATLDVAMREKYSAPPGDSGMWFFHVTPR